MVFVIPLAQETSCLLSGDDASFQKFAAEVVPLVQAHAILMDATGRRQHHQPRQPQAGMLQRGRVERDIRRSPNCSSRCATRRDTEDLGRPRRSAALLKLPASATRA